MKQHMICIAAAALAAVILAVAAAAPAVAVSSGPWNISETSGGYAVGTPDITAGAQVVETRAANARNMTWNQTTTYSGDPAGFWKFSNGNFMAANTACNGVTVKSSSSSDGTIWALKHNADGSYYIVNRYCDQQLSSPDDVALAGFNISGHQYTVCGPSHEDCSGLYRRQTLNPA